MGSHGAQLIARLAAVAARLPAVPRLARSAARRVAGRHYVAAVAVIIDDGSVLLARHRFRGDRWSLPGGWVRRLEDPARACEREVAEELGISVTAVAPVAVELHAVDDRPVSYGGLSLAYRCVATGAREQAVAASIEITEVRWVDTASVAEFVDGFQLDALEAALRHQDADSSDR